MRRFQICENTRGLATWSVAELVEGRTVLLCEVTGWRADGLRLAANALGIITVDAAGFILQNNIARFA